MTDSEATYYAAGYIDVDDTPRLEIGDTHSADDEVEEYR